MAEKAKVVKKELNIFLIMPFVLLGVILILFIGEKFVNSENTNQPTDQTEKEQYQAIFLENGQVYFGKIESEDEKYINLKDIYYLQVNNQLDTQTDNTNQSNLKLVKLGTEIHGPENEMRINYQQVLFIENLREDSDVVKVILEDKANNQ
jgi:hypothetical protein